MKELTYSIIEELKLQYPENEFNYYRHSSGNIVSIVHDKDDIYSDAIFAQLQFNLITDFNKDNPDLDIFFLNKRDLNLYPGLLNISDTENNFESWINELLNAPQNYLIGDNFSNCSTEASYALAA